MPSDILGTEVIEEDVSTGKRHIRFIPGPIFANIILADEINRTPPRTQAALLEAMQEYQVTVGGMRYALERPLFVLATENPDRAGRHVPAARSAARSLHVQRRDRLSGRRRRAAHSRARRRREAAPVAAVATGAELERARMLVRELPAAENVVDYALRLVRATRPGDPTAPPLVREWVRWGAGPRAGQALLLGAKARALLDGRSVPALDDITASRCPCSGIGCC